MLMKFDRGSKKLAEFALKDVMFSTVALPNATEKQVHGMIQNSIARQFTSKGMTIAPM